MGILRFPLPDNLLLYTAAAVLPAAVLMFYIYRKDRVEKEPGKLLGKLLLGGVLAAFAAMALEYGSDYLLTLYAESTTMSLAGFGVLTAASVAVIEEISKFFFLRRFSWNHPAFNYRFDGIVYAVFVSLGFAAFENILYVFFYGGLEVALPRALLAIPAHMSFAVYMGLMYGIAKGYERRGNEQKTNLLQTAGFLMAVILHALYDGSIMAGTPASVMFFYGFVALMDIMVIITIHRASKYDRRID